MSSKNNLRSRISFFAFVTPAFMFVLVFMACPMIAAMLYSFSNWNGLSPTFKFINLNNYWEIFLEDQKFKTSILFTLKFTLVMVILQNVLALLIAILIERVKKSKRIFRTIFFLPNMISAIVGAYMLKFIFLKVFPQFGQRFSLIGFLNQPWMANAGLAFWAIVLGSLWIGIGYMIIIYLAGLETIPAELEDQVLLEGPNPWQKFFTITLPMIMPAVTICVFLTINGSLKAFDLIFALTNGGPGWSTASIGLHIYYDAFDANMRMGYACAKAIMLFILILVVSLIQINLMKKREVEL